MVEGELDLAAQASSDFRHVRSAPIAGMITRMPTRFTAVADLQRRLLVLEELAAYAALLRREALAREVTRREREISGRSSRPTMLICPPPVSR